MNEYGLIISLLLGAVKSIFWGIVFLFVAFVILPASVMDKILSKLRPDLISKERIITRIKVVFDYIFNQKDVVVSSTSDENQKEIEKELRKLMMEKRLLEGNLFFLDLLQNLTVILFFSISKAGYDEKSIPQILEQSMEYLTHYSNQLKNTSGAINQTEKVSDAASNFGEQIQDMVEYLKKEEGEKTFQIAKMKLKQDAQSFSTFMKNEFESTKHQLSTTNQLLAEKFMSFIES